MTRKMLSLSERVEAIRLHWEMFSRSRTNNGNRRIQIQQSIELLTIAKTPIEIERE
jgi:hypothetical protein